MRILIEVGKWLGMVVIGFILAAAAVVGIFSWLLNHPAD
jgi:hypothetical protein